MMKTKEKTKKNKMKKIREGEFTNQSIFFLFLTAIASLAFIIRLYFSPDIHTQHSCESFLPSHSSSSSSSAWRLSWSLVPLRFYSSSQTSKTSLCNPLPGWWIPAQKSFILLVVNFDFYRNEVLERSSLPRVRRWKVERWGLVRKKWNGSSKRKPVNRLWNARKPVVRLVYSHPSRLRKKAQTREET